VALTVTSLIRSGFSKSSLFAKFNFHDFTQGARDKAFESLGRFDGLAITAVGFLVGFAFAAFRSKLFAFALWRVTFSRYSRGTYLCVLLVAVVAIHGFAGALLARVLSCSS
ncbi:hypothetical protein A2U01_0037994, partial [Trifolium medium]|nr:hypothetical protein [Trifolium medium]